MQHLVVDFYCQVEEEASWYTSDKKQTKFEQKKKNERKKDKQARTKRIKIDKSLSHKIKKKQQEMEWNEKV